MRSLVCKRLALEKVSTTQQYPNCKNCKADVGYLSILVLFLPVDLGVAVAVALDVRLEALVSCLQGGPKEVCGTSECVLWPCPSPGYRELQLSKQYSVC